MERPVEPRQCRRDGKQNALDVWLEYANKMAPKLDDLEVKIDRLSETIEGLAKDIQGLRNGLYETRDDLYRTRMDFFRGHVEGIRPKSPGGSWNGMVMTEHSRYDSATKPRYVYFRDEDYPEL